MNYVFSFLVVLIVGELLSILLFRLFDKYFNHGKNKISIRSVIKGNLERLFLFMSLVNGLPQSFIVFGAIKIGTRLKDKEDAISNDYFLVGNLMSLILSISYYLIYELIVNG